MLDVRDLVETALAVEHGGSPEAEAPIALGAAIAQEDAARGEALWKARRQVLDESLRTLQNVGLHLDAVFALPRCARVDGGVRGVACGLEVVACLLESACDRIIMPGGILPRNKRLSRRIRGHLNALEGELLAIEASAGSAEEWHDVLAGLERIEAACRSRALNGTDAAEAFGLLPAELRKMLERRSASVRAVAADDAALPAAPDTAPREAPAPSAPSAPAAATPAAMSREEIAARFAQDLQPPSGDAAEIPSPGDAALRRVVAWRCVSGPNGEADGRAVWGVGPNESDRRDDREAFAHCQTDWRRRAARIEWLCWRFPLWLDAQVWAMKVFDEHPDGRSVASQIRWMLRALLDRLPALETGFLDECSGSGKVFPCMSAECRKWWKASSGADLPAASPSESEPVQVCESSSGEPLTPMDGLLETIDQLLAAGELEEPRQRLQQAIPVAADGRLRFALQVRLMEVLARSGQVDDATMLAIALDRRQARYVKRGWDHDLAMQFARAVIRAVDGCDASCEQFHAVRRRARLTLLALAPGALAP